MYPLPFGGPLLLAVKPIERALLVVSGKAHSFVVHGELRKFFLNRRNSIKYRIELFPDFSYIAFAVFMQVVPVLLQNLLHLAQQLDCFFDDIT